MIKLKITTHSGTEDILEVKTYDPIQVFTELNDKENYHILIGENIYSKIDIKSIFKIEETEQTP